MEPLNLRVSENFVKTLRVYENTFENHDFGRPKNPFVTGSPENPWSESQ